MPHFSPNELIEKSSVRSLVYDTSYKATIPPKIHDHKAENHINIKFLVEWKDCEVDEITCYKALCEYIEELEDEHVDPNK